MSELGNIVVGILVVVLVVAWCRRLRDIVGEWLLARQRCNDASRTAGILRNPPADPHMSPTVSTVARPSEILVYTVDLTTGEYAFDVRKSTECYCSVTF